MGVTMKLFLPVQLGVFMSISMSASLPGSMEQGNSIREESAKLSPEQCSIAEPAGQASVPSFFILQILRKGVLGGSSVPSGIVISEINVDVRF